MSDAITFASRLSDYELSAFFTVAGNVDLGLLELERIIRDTGAEMTIKNVCKFVSLLNGYIIEETQRRCSGG